MGASPRRPLTCTLILLAVVLAVLAGCGSSATQPAPVIALFSDNGPEGYRLAAMRGSAYAVFPEARVVDGAVGMAPFDVPSAAYAIDLASTDWPAGSIIVCAWSSSMKSVKTSRT